MPEQVNESLFRRLSDPFPYENVSWAVVETAPGGQKVFVIPHVIAPHFKARLDAAAPGWNADYEVIDPDDPYIRCTLTIEGIKRDGIGDVWASDDSFAGKQDRAFIRACQGFGLGKYLQFISGVWVDYDKETHKITPPNLPVWALPGGCGYPANVPGKRQPPQLPKTTSDKNLRKPANFQQPQSATIQNSAKSRANTSAPVSPSKQSPQPEKAQSTQPKPAQTPPAAEKQPDDAIANAQALKAWGDLALKAHLAGIANIESVRPPIRVGELRKRYAALKKQLDQIQNGGQTHE